MQHMSQSEALELIGSNDIKFVRLAFCDIYGRQKNVSIQSAELQRAFESGIAFDASSIRGFSDAAHSDLFLFPDPTTLSMLPWRPSRGGVARFFCDIRDPEGKPFSADCRQYLKEAEKLLRENGIVCSIGAELEFYLFRCDENGNPTDMPLDQAGYFDIAPADCGENVRRDICMTLEEMGIQPERSHHEQGPGQNEIDFKCSTALHAADNVVTFKQVVSTIAARNGLWASFWPKPIPTEAGNGFHINISLTRPDNGAPAEKSVFMSFMAGVLAHAAEMSAILNPLESSYERIGKDNAPSLVSWSPQNRSQLIRIPATDLPYERMELRSPDTAANPYLAFALVMRAGLDGVLNKMTPPEACSENLLAASEEVRAKYASLPTSLPEARRVLESSSFIKEALPAHIFSDYTRRV